MPLLADDFHLVVPSMPGFAFSTPVVGSGWTMDRVARVYDVLMRRLGYDSYGAHGSDGGAMVGRELAVLDPDGFLGAHVLQLFSFPSGDPAEFEAFGPVPTPRPARFATTTPSSTRRGRQWSATAASVSRSSRTTSGPSDRSPSATTPESRTGAEFDRGGHFAVLEVPELVARDLRAFFG
ncbi:alpha/beta fold hydrolase [Actinoplanes sp. URMC 104]|uniref:alpha/beta fold hydrolase n=1 Tax=Actinoplanes sp. URMC 104 TaxID=3423409 RepID=UPI003F199CA1